MDLDLVYSYFISHLKGLIEDDPIPYEIKSLVFFVNKNNEIGFSGSEQEKVDLVDLYFYCPLEAEYFDYKPLYNFFSNNNFNQNDVLEYLKNILLKLKKDSYFKDFHIFYGFLNFKAKKI